MSSEPRTITEVKFAVEALLGENYQVFAKDVTDSTMQDARLAIANGLQSKALFFAGEQLAGKGRRGTTWESSNGAVLMTVAIPISEIALSKNLYTLAAGVGVLKVVRSYNKAFLCKWPNDIVDQTGRKLAGILTEMVPGPETENWLSVGIGLNLKTAPPYAVALSEFLVQSELPSRADCLSQIVLAVDKSLRQGRDIEIVKLANEFLYRPATIQRFEYENSILGIEVTGVAADGALMARVNNALQTFVTGHFVRD